MHFQRLLLINYTLCGAWYKALWNGCCSFKIHGESYMYFSTTEHYIDEAKNSFNYSGDSPAHCHCMPHRLTRIIDYNLTVFFFKLSATFCFLLLLFFCLKNSKMTNRYKSNIESSRWFRGIASWCYEYSDTMYSQLSSPKFHKLVHLDVLRCKQQNSVGHISMSDILSHIESRVWKDNFIHVLLNHHWRYTSPSNYITVHHGRNYLSIRQFHWNQSVGGEKIALFDKNLACINLHNSGGLRYHYCIRPND